MRKNNIIKIICIICLLTVFALLFFPWMSSNGKVYTLIEYYSYALNCDGLEVTEYMLLGIFALPILVGVLSCVKAIFFLFHRNPLLLGRIIYGLAWVNVAFFFAFQAYEPYPACFLATIFTFAEFLLERYLRDYEEFTAEWRRQKAQEKLEKEERKRRLSFPGKYDSKFWKVLMEGAMHQRRAVLLMGVGNSVLLGAVFTLFGLKMQLESEYSVTTYLPTEGLSGILSDALIVVVVLYAFFELAAFYNYTKNNSFRNRMLWMLGAREDLQTKIKVIEYDCSGQSLYFVCTFVSADLLHYGVRVRRYPKWPVAGEKGAGREAFFA